MIYDYFHFKGVSINLHDRATLNVTNKDTLRSVKYAQFKDCAYSFCFQNYLIKEKYNMILIDCTPNKIRLKISEMFAIWISLFWVSKKITWDTAVNLLFLAFEFITASL